jgi:two-component system NtrC family sensor kinase
MNGPLAFMRTNLKVLAEHADRIGRLDGEPRPDELADIAGDSRDIVAECLEGLDRIAAMVQSLRGLVRDTGTTERFDPAAPIAEAVEVFRRAQRDRCEVGLALSGDLPALEGSPAALTHVVLNLLENGLDAMGGSGVLQVRATRSGTWLRLDVEDRGPGVPGEIRGRLFEPYFTTKPVGKGTGLGLYICRELVTRLGGQIGFESGPGGTVFRVQLPGAR